MVLCEKCNRRYNDEYRWTICPHDPLEAGSGRPYCSRHDLFNCHLCKPVKPAEVQV